jgi:hypothetical protein
MAAEPNQEAVLAAEAYAAAVPLERGMAAQGIGINRGH